MIRDMSTTRVCRFFLSFLLLVRRLLQVQGKEGEDAGPDHGPNNGVDGEGGTGRAGRRGLSCQDGGGRGGGHEDSTGNLSHFHC